MQLSIYMKKVCITFKRLPNRLVRSKFISFTEKPKCPINISMDVKLLVVQLFTMAAFWSLNTG